MKLDTKDIFEIRRDGKEIRFIYCNEQAAYLAWKKQWDEAMNGADLIDLF